MVPIPAHDGGVAVAKQCDGGALGGVPNAAYTDQLSALLGPDTAAASVDPRRPGVRIVAGTAHDGGVAVARQCDGPALGPPPCAAGTHQPSPLRPETTPWRMRPNHDAGGHLGAR